MILSPEDSRTLGYAFGIAIVWLTLGSWLGVLAGSIIAGILFIAAVAYECWKYA